MDNSDPIPDRPIFIPQRIFCIWNHPDPPATPESIRVFLGLGPTYKVGEPVSFDHTAALNHVLAWWERTYNDTFLPYYKTLNLEPYRLIILTPKHSYFFANSQEGLWQDWICKGAWEDAEPLLMAPAPDERERAELGARFRLYLKDIDEYNLMVQQTAGLGLLDWQTGRHNQFIKPDNRDAKYVEPPLKGEGTWENFLDEENRKRGEQANSEREVVNNGEANGVHLTEEPVQDEEDGVRLAEEEAKDEEVDGARLAGEQASGEHLVEEPSASSPDTFITASEDVLPVFKVAEEEARAEVVEEEEEEEERPVVQEDDDVPASYFRLVRSESCW